MSKGYTIAYYMRIIKKCPRNSTTQAIIEAIAPRSGMNSQKFKTLNDWTDNKLGLILIGAGKYYGYGSTPRARLLKVLRFRKVWGLVP